MWKCQSNTKWMPNAVDGSKYFKPMPNQCFFGILNVNLHSTSCCYWDRNYQKLTSHFPIQCLTKTCIWIWFHPFSLKIVLTFIHKSNLLAMVHVHVLLKELNYNCILTMNTTLCSKFELKCGKLFWFHCRTYYSNPTFLLLYRGIIMLQNPSPLAFLSPCMHFSTQVINNNTKVPIPYQVLTCILVSGCIKH